MTPVQGSILGPGSATQATIEAVAEIITK